MTKHTLAYWGTTGLAALAMAGSGVVDVMMAEDVLAVLRRLGYPDYLAVILGVAKLLGAVAIVAPPVPRWIREWAYAGFVFDLGGAVISHFAVGDPIAEAMKPGALLVLIIASYALWRTRPERPNGG